MWPGSPPDQRHSAASHGAGAGTMPTSPNPSEGGLLYFALACSLVAFAASTAHIYGHLSNFTERAQQQHIVRILVIVPVYGELPASVIGPGCVATCVLCACSHVLRSSFSPGLVAIAPLPQPGISLGNRCRRCARSDISRVCVCVHSGALLCHRTRLLRGLRCVLLPGVGTRVLRRRWDMCGENAGEGAKVWAAVCRFCDHRLPGLLLSGKHPTPVPSVSTGPRLH